MSEFGGNSDYGDTNYDAQNFSTYDPNKYDDGPTKRGEQQRKRRKNPSHAYGQGYLTNTNVIRPSNQNLPGATMRGWKGGDEDWKDGPAPYTAFASGLHPGKPLTAAEKWTMANRTAFQVDQAARDKAIGLGSDLILEGHVQALASNRREDLEGAGLIGAESIYSDEQTVMRGKNDWEFVNKSGVNELDEWTDLNMPEHSNTSLTQPHGRNDNSRWEPTGTEATTPRDELGLALSGSSNSSLTEILASQTKDSDRREVRLHNRRQEIMSRRRKEFAAYVKEHSNDRLRRSGFGGSTALSAPKAPSTATTGTTLLRAGGSTNA